MDNIQKYKIKREAAKMLVNVYDLAIKRETEGDSLKKSEISEDILNLKLKREKLLKRVAE